MNFRLPQISCLLVLLALGAARLVAATSVLLTAGVLRDAAGNPLPDGALVVLVASTTDAAFAPPTPGAALQPGATLVDDDVVLATWTVDSTRTGLAGTTFRTVNFDYAQAGIPGLNAGDPLMLYWFPAATPAHAVATPGAAYGSYRTETLGAHSNLNWFAPDDVGGGTFELSILTVATGGDVANALGNASASVAIPAPVITTQPADRLAVIGREVSMTVVAQSLTPLTYQWKMDGADIRGATASTFTIAHVTPKNFGRYTVVITNDGGSVTSRVVRLDVIPRGFNVIAYLARYPNHAALFKNDFGAAWIYYRDHGIYEGELFDDEFRVEEYLALYPELFAIYGGDLGEVLMHWLETGQTEGRLGRIPPGFDAPGYLARNPDVAAAVQNNLALAWWHFWNYGIYEGRAYDDEFRVFEYLVLNADLQAAFLNDWRGATMHWLRYGRTEGRLGRIPLIFNPSNYLKLYPDVQAVWGDYPTTVWLHFWLYGIDENREVDADFRADEYLALNPDLSAVFGRDRRGAFMHWVRYGRSEGRPGRNP